MGKTKRNASRWMESRFKYGDPSCPKWNEDFFDGRYQNKMRNESRSYHTEKIDPLSYKVASWRNCGRNMKVLAKRKARHNAKLLMVKLTNEILLEIQMDLEDLWTEEQWYDRGYIGFDFSYSDEAYDYAEQRRLEEMQDEYASYWDLYGPYGDWDY